MRTQLISKETILVNLLIKVVHLFMYKCFLFLSRSKAFCFCHRSLDCIAAYIKMSLLQVYNSIHKFDVICLSETYLDNSYHSDDDQLA